MNDVKVYAYYPRGLRTGGPEALHQLVDCLRQRCDVEAYLVPLADSQLNDRVAEYAKYDAPEALTIDDTSSSTVVAPERVIRLLSRFKLARRACWWLSIDNSLWFGSRRVPGWRGYRRRLEGELRRRVENRYVDLHLAQSDYAWAYLSGSLGINPLMLSDYTLTGDLVNVVRKVPRSDERLLVSFNEVKSGDRVRRLRCFSDSNIEWLPINRMSRDDVVATLGRSHVYLDLGDHPGKDRMPREAALCGNVVVVGLRGAALHTSDVPVPGRYKVRTGLPGDRDVDNVLSYIRSNLGLALAEQEAFRLSILGERDRFYSEAQNIFSDRALPGTSSVMLDVLRSERT